jgi:hypothetical protein
VCRQFAANLHRLVTEISDVLDRRRGPLNADKNILAVGEKSK